MAAPARKYEDEDDKVARAPQPAEDDPHSIPSNGQTSDIPPSVSRLVNQSQKQAQGPQRQDTYQPQNVPAGFKAPQPIRTSLQGRAFKAGRGVGQIHGEIGNLAENGLPGQRRQPQETRPEMAGQGHQVATGLAAAEAEKPSATGKTDPLRGVAQEAARDLKGPQMVAWVLVGLVCGSALVQSIISLGIFIPGQIVVLSFLFISPKWTYKGILFGVSLFAGPEVYKYGQYVDPNDIKLTPVQRAIIVLEIVILGLGLLLEIFVVVNVTCRLVDAGPRALTFVASRTASALSGTNLPSGVRDACIEINSFMSNLISGSPNNGSSYSGGVPAGSVKEYAGFIDQSAQANNIEYCMIEALVRKESGGKSNIYSTFVLREDGGSGQVYPAGYINVDNPDKLFYGLSFDPYGHAIGLTQISIYHNRSTWQNSSTPSRSRSGFGGSGGEYFTIQDLLSPAANIAAGSFYYATLLKQANGDPVRAYGYYQGGPGVSNSTYNSPQFQATLRIFNNYYQECKTRT